MSNNVNYYPIIAVLLTTPEDSFPWAITTNAAVGHDSILKTTIDKLNSSSLVFPAKVSSSEVRPNQVGSLETNVPKFSSVEDGIGQIATKTSTADFGIGQIDSNHIILPPEKEVHIILALVRSAPLKFALSASDCQN